MNKAEYYSRINSYLQHSSEPKEPEPIDVMSTLESLTKNKGRLTRPQAIKTVNNLKKIKDDIIASIKAESDAAKRKEMLENLGMIIAKLNKAIDSIE